MRRLDVLFVVNWTSCWTNSLVADDTGHMTLMWRHRYVLGCTLTMSRVCVNKTLRNKFHWHVNCNSKELYFQENAFENAFCKYRPFCLGLNELGEVFIQEFIFQHYGDVVMGTIASQITSLAIVYSTVYSGAYQRKHQSSTSLAFVRGIHWGPVNSPHKWPVTRKMFPFDDVIMRCRLQNVIHAARASIQ